jgi:hypothetical protein
MFSGQGDEFGGLPGAGADGGLGFGGGAGGPGAGGPPPADAMFESFFNDGLDDLEAVETAVEPRENEVFAAGLHFFNNMRKMK